MGGHSSSDSEQEQFKHPYPTPDNSPKSAPPTTESNVIPKTFAFIPRAATQFLEENPYLVRRCESIPCSISTDIFSIESVFHAVIFLQCSREHSEKVDILAREITRKSNLRVVVRVSGKRKGWARSAFTTVEDDATESKPGEESGIVGHVIDPVDQNAEMIDDMHHGQSEVVDKYSFGVLTLEYKGLEGSGAGKKVSLGVASTGGGPVGEASAGEGGPSDEASTRGGPSGEASAGGGGGNTDHVLVLS